MKSCVECGGQLKSTVRIDGKSRKLNHRKRCLTCLPWKAKRKRKSKIRGISGRLCCICEKPIRGTSRTRCGACDTTVRRIRNKLAAVAYLGGKCSRCGYGNPWSLHFHHPKQKDFEIGSASSSWQTIKEEISRCTLLCANCHGEEHATRRGRDKQILQAALTLGNIRNTELSALLLEYLTGLSRYTK